MDLVEFIILLIVAGVCGALGQAISGFSRGGFVVSIALGFIGALLGIWIARSLKLPEIFVLELGDVRFPIIWAILGSALFVAVLGFLTRGRRD
jgi:uncharacterized membrane protein YeaQ/YmgE (transglycosylase-associated protein family)